MAKNKGLSFYHRKSKISSALVREIFNWIFIIFVAIFLGTVGVYFLGMTSGMVGESMENSLYNGQTVLVNRFVYVLSTPKPGDVVIFLPNGNENSHYYIKRVVATSGDTVQIKNGILYVNGEESKFIKEKILDPGIAENEFRLASGEVFCIGDNVNNSEDSRSANVGPVKEEFITGKVWFKLKCSKDKMGFVD